MSLLRPQAYHIDFNFVQTVEYEKAIGRMGVMFAVDHKHYRVTKQCLEMFQRNPDEFLCRFITVDETWIHYFTPETKEQSKQWTSRGEPALKKTKTNDGDLKRLRKKIHKKRS